MTIKFKNFKSVDGQAKRVALMSGHTYIIGDTWVLLPDFAWSEAYSKGCASEEMIAAVERGDTLASLVNVNTLEENLTEKLQTLFRAWMETAAEDCFDSKGMPKLAKVRAALGAHITKMQVVAAYADLED